MHSLIFIIAQKKANQPMPEASTYLTTDSLCQQCKKWYRLQRKTRRDAVWMTFFQGLFALIFPEIHYSQLLIKESQMFQHFQLFFNSSVSCHQRKKGEILNENPAVDFILCLEGVMEYTNVQGARYQWKTNQIVVFAKQVSLKPEKIPIKIIENCTYLHIDRKLMDKFKNDVLRQDREIKEEFMSSYLFCNFTPVYYMSNIHVIWVKEGHDVEVKNGLVFLLYSGVIKRKVRNEKIIDGTELTKGCIINCRMLANVLDKGKLFTQEEDYETKVDSVVLSFQLQEMIRILKLNANLKKLLENKLKVISSERAQIAKKSTEIIAKFNERLKIENQSIEIHYSVDFKTRNVKSAVPLNRSFRRVKDRPTSDFNYGEFITFDKYDKMIESKEKVALTKHSYINREKKRERPIHTADYEKKLKMQNKMIKIQTGKIQKISQRDSKRECNVQQMEEIKRNLFQVTHLFDEPLQEMQAHSFEIKPQPKKSKTFNNLATLQHKNPRVSNLKPQEYLKNEYLTEFNSKSRVRYSLKDLEKDSNKENPSYMDRTDTNFLKKSRQLRVICNQLTNDK